MFQHPARLMIILLALGMMGQATAPKEATTATGPATMAARLTIPPAAARNEALVLIQRLFRDEYGSNKTEDKALLAKRLLKEAAGTRDDMTARFVLLDQAALLAADGGVPDTLVAAVDQTEREYVMDGAARKSVLLQQCANHVAGGDIDRLVAQAFAAMDAAVGRDDFVMAARMADLAEETAGRKQSVAFSAGIQPRLRNFRLLAEERGLAQAAQKVLLTVEDAGAHATLGRYLAMGLGDFAGGLPHLARGNDGPLAAVAQADLANPTTAEGQVKVADLWWAIAELQTDHHKAQSAARAQYWYRLAKQNITGITLSKINARLGEVTPGVADAAHAPGHVNLLATIDADKDGIAGGWKRGEDGLTVTPGKYARLALPVRAPEEYDLVVHFTRTEISGHSPGTVAIMLTYRDKPFDVSLSDMGGTARLEAVNKKAVKDNPTVVPLKLENGQPYVVTAQVRKNGVKILLDGKLLTEYKTDYKDLSVYDAWKLKDPTLLGVGANAAGVRFDTIELVPITGEPRLLRGSK